MTAFHEASFKATHNSYSGNIAGERGSLVEQLDAGVRSIELDLHTDNFAAVGDYEIGHDTPGAEVWHQGGNPAGNRFSDWLGVIASWSRKNQRHAPITLVLDIKSGWGSLPNAAAGNHGAVNARLANAFGGSLVPPGEVFNWPDVEAMRGLVLVVLSGTANARDGYLVDRADNPALATNMHGQVIEVHESTTDNHLSYWTGQRLEGGRVMWRRHGRYDSGKQPAVALNDDGWIVEVHKSENHDRLWYRVGKLTDDLDVEWGDSHEYDAGVSPTVRFDETQGLTLREIHRSPSALHNWQWWATLDPATRTLSWSGNSRTNDARWISDVADGIAVQTGPGDVLRYRTPTVDLGAVRYEQLAFVEHRPSDTLTESAGTRFAACSPDNSDFQAQMRLAGMVVRAWQFTAATAKLEPPVNFPATDTPFASWYTSYCAQIGAIE